MIRPNFLTTADRLELLFCVKRQREDHGVARRANALLLLDDGMSCSQIAKVLFLDDDTVRASTSNIWLRTGKPSPTMGGKAGSHG